MDGRKRSWLAVWGLILVSIHLLTGCRKIPAYAPQPITPSATNNSTTSGSGLNDEERRAIESLDRVDDHPLYVMAHAGTGKLEPSAGSVQSPAMLAYEPEAWTCSLFTGSSVNGRIFGRNFDWEHSPALLLFLQPETGYASVSIVDLVYLFPDRVVPDLLDLEIEALAPLLQAWRIPFDGMNEAGLAIGMAAVPEHPQVSSPGQPAFGSLGVMRQVLDRAANVDQALEIFQQVNVLWGGGPALHYLIADRDGNSALIEYYRGEMLVRHGSGSWQAATNFLQAEFGEGAAGVCTRYDRLHAVLSAAGGILEGHQLRTLLADVAQASTQWSVLYDLAQGEIEVFMGGDPDRTHWFTMGEGILPVGEAIPDP